VHDQGSRVTVEKGAQLTVGGRGSIVTNQNQAVLESLGSSLISVENSAVLSNSTGAQIRNLGALSVSTGASLINDSIIQNGGGVIIDAASLLSGNGTYTQTGTTQVDGLMVQGLTEPNSVMACCTAAALSVASCTTRRR
jgi:hypothetical protein